MFILKCYQCDCRVERTNNISKPTCFSCTQARQRETALEYAAKKRKQKDFKESILKRKQYENPRYLKRNGETSARRYAY